MTQADPPNDSDLGRIIRLIGKSALQPGGVREKRRFLLDGLSDMIHADGWFASRDDEIQEITDATSVTSSSKHSSTIGHTETSASGTSHIALFRTAGRAPFTVSQENTARLILQETVWLHGFWDDLAIGEPLPDLFPQELTTLRHLSAGKARKEVASEMNLSESTVSTYTKNIFRKLGVHSQTELMKKFLNGKSQPPPT